MSVASSTPPAGSSGSLVDRVALPQPPAARLRPPSWRDRRLAVGVLLVLASVTLGATLIGRAGGSEPVYAATHVLVTGQRLEPGDLRVVRVRLGSESGHYLSARHALGGDRVVVRSVPAGELLPASALGPASEVLARPVSVPASSGDLDGLRAGDLVDVWVAQKAVDHGSGGSGSAVPAQRDYDEPKVLARAAEVVMVSRLGGVLAGSSGDTTVRLLIADDLVPQVLSAINNEARIGLVPVPGSVSRGGS